MAEATDYEFILRDILLPAVIQQGRGDGPSTVSLLLAGYSYGCLAASACSPPEDVGEVRFETSYLLISYPLSVAWALCALQSSFFVSALRTRTRDYRVLAVHGDQDQFTAVSKLRRWATELGQESNSFRCVEFPGADHFWRQRDSKAELLSVIRAWCTSDRDSS